METNLIEQFNDSAIGQYKQLEASKNLDKILPIAKWVTYGTILAALICIFSGESCSISSLLGMRYANKGTLGALFCIVCFMLSYLIPIVNLYIIHAIDVSLDVVKPEYQVSRNMTSFLKWGYLIIGIMNLAIDIADISDSIAYIGLPFFIAFIVIQVIWVRQLSKKWAMLSSKHKNVADLLRNYVYLSIACCIVGIIGGIISEGVGDFVNYVISGGVDLYLFYLFGSYYSEMAILCANIENNQIKQQ